MIERVLIPELLDHLPADDPSAQRSRRDLRRINFFMGNERWVCRQARRLPQIAARGIVEIGAGGGELCHQLAEIFPHAPVSAYDLAPAPEFPGSRVRWHRGDLFETSASTSGGLLVANLFIHHFEGEALSDLGRWMAHFEGTVINEPDRCRVPHLLGGLARPFINHVTRHDMHASIRAGFAEGELAEFLGLDSAVWQIRETSTWRGARRVVALRR